MTTESPLPKEGNTQEAGPVLALIKQIKENKVDPAVLSAEDRRRCVDVLWGEGYTVAETAHAILYLACDEHAGFMTGVNLPLDGGALAGGG